MVMSRSLICSFQIGIEIFEAQADDDAKEESPGGGEFVAVVDDILPDIMEE